MSICFKKYSEKCLVFSLSILFFSITSVPHPTNAHQLHAYCLLLDTHKQKKLFHSHLIADCIDGLDDNEVSEMVNFYLVVLDWWKCSCLVSFSCCVECRWSLNFVSFIYGEFTHFIYLFIIISLWSVPKNNQNFRLSFGLADATSRNASCSLHCRSNCCGCCSFCLMVVDCCVFNFPFCLVGGLIDWWCWCWESLWWMVVID